MQLMKGNNMSFEKEINLEKLKVEKDNYLKILLLDMVYLRPKLMILFILWIKQIIEILNFQLI